MCSRLDQSDMRPDTQPILKPIMQHVSRLTKHRSSSVRTLSRDITLLLNARSASSVKPSAGSGRSQTLQQYQEALKLLQDPIMPIRAHGLMILQGVVKAPDFDRALVPAILDVFLSALKDDDSYMYLHAVRGLSSLVDGLGKEILRTLARTYEEDLEKEKAMQPSELDYRLRVGEAIQQSVRRCGAALGGYGEISEMLVYNKTRC